MQYRYTHSANRRDRKANETRHLGAGIFARRNRRRVEELGTDSA